MFGRHLKVNRTIAGLATVVAFASIPVLIGGCASPAPHRSELQDIRQVNSERLSRVWIGMPRSEFSQIFSDAYVGGQSGETTAFELALKQQYVADEDWGDRDLDRSIGLAPPKPRTDTQVLWFYFYGDKLVKWGRPNDWPANPDETIEVRVK